jgi:hypothetical protein
MTHAVTLRNQVLRDRQKKSEFVASVPQSAACCANACKGMAINEIFTILYIYPSLAL